MRFGAKPVLLVGQVLIVAGLVLFALSPVHSSYVSDLLAPMLLLGIGAGLSFPSLMGLAMSSATRAGLGACLRTGQHLAPGRWCARARRPGDPLGDSHRQPAGERDLARRSPDQRFPPRLLDRRRTGHRSGRDHDPGDSVRARRLAEAERARRARAGARGRARLLGGRLAQSSPRSRPAPSGAGRGEGRAPPRSAALRGLEAVDAPRRLGPAGRRGAPSASASRRDAPRPARRGPPPRVTAGSTSSSRPRWGCGSWLASVQRPSASSSPVPCPRRMASALVTPISWTSGIARLGAQCAQRPVDDPGRVPKLLGTALAGRRSSP